MGTKEKRSASVRSNLKGEQGDRGEPDGNRLPARKTDNAAPVCKAVQKLEPDQHVYLQVGDRVFHKKYRSWGYGIVIEAMASAVPGGLCYVRIQFQDGKKRVFDNNLDSNGCCYYSGITLLNRIEL